MCTHLRQATLVITIESHEILEYIAGHNNTPFLNQIIHLRWFSTFSLVYGSTRETRNYENMQRLPRLFLTMSRFLESLDSYAIPKNKLIRNPIQISDGIPNKSPKDASTKLFDDLLLFDHLLFFVTIHTLHNY